MSSPLPHNRLVHLFVLAVACLLAAPALGAGAEKPKKKHHFVGTPCEGAYDAFCSVSKGWRAGFDCLRARYEKDELSEECAAYTDDVLAKRKNPFLETTCAEDYETFCAASKGWRLGFDCLRRSYDENELGEECAAHTDHVLEVKRNRVKVREKAWRDACAADIQKNCSQYEKQLAIKGCLYRIRDQVAPLCDEKLPYRPGYAGPGFVGFKDGSEPADYDEARHKRLHTGDAEAVLGGRLPVPSAEQQQRAAALEAERQKIRDQVRARIQANRAAAQAKASGETPAGDSDSKVEDAPSP